MKTTTPRNGKNAPTTETIWQRGSVRVEVNRTTKTYTLSDREGVAFTTTFTGANWRAIRADVIARATQLAN